MEFDISVTRLHSQLLAEPKFKTAKDVVAHFGAMQAQDFPMAKWAVGVRWPHSTDAQIQEALDKGDIIRTHVLRPTWHFAAAEDIHWMLQLSGKNISRAMGSSNRALGLDDKTLNKSNDKIREILQSGKHLAREEIMEALGHYGIKTHENRSSHLLMYAELSGIICSGKREAKNHTYALLDERVKKTKSFSREEALAELAKRYFTSHGPATLKDFGWWSGLSVSDAKMALEFNRKNLIGAEIDGQTYYRIDSGFPEIENSVLLLPSFDEFLIAYKDRSASIHIDHKPHAFTNNGIFWPIIVLNGQVAGTWRRSIKKDKILIETRLLHKVPKGTDKKILSEAKRYGDFMNKTVEVAF